MITQTTLIATEARIMLYLAGDVFDRCNEFYRHVLNLPVRTEWNDPGSRGIMFELGACVLELLHNSDTPVTKHDSNIVLAVRVDHVKQLWIFLSDKLDDLKKPEARPWGDTDFAIHDPSGFKIVFFTPTNQI